MTGETISISRVQQTLYCVVPNRILRSILKKGLHVDGTENGPAERQWVFYDHMPCHSRKEAVLCVAMNRVYRRFSTELAPPDTLLERYAQGWRFRENVTIPGAEIMTPFEIKPTDEDGAYSFEFPDRVRHLIVPGKVRAMDDCSFRDRKLLERVEISPQTQYIGCDSFSDCPNLHTVIHLGRNLKFGDNRCFCNCPNLREVLMDVSSKAAFRQKSDGTWYLGQWGEWFQGCPKLLQVRFLDGSSLCLKKEALSDHQQR